TRLLKFALLLTQEFFFQVIHTCLVSARTLAIAATWPRLAGAVVAVHSPVGSLRRLRPLWRLLVRADHLHQVEVARGVFFEALHHGFEHFKRFTLVLNEWIVLAVPA